MSKWPIFNPILKLLHSRAALILIANAILILIVAARPDAAQLIENVIKPILAASIAVILKIGVEDAAASLAGAPKTLPDALAAALNQSLKELVDPEIAAQLPTITPELIAAILRGLKLSGNTTLSPEQVAIVAAQVTKQLSLGNPKLVG